MEGKNVFIRDERGFSLVELLIFSLLLLLVLSAAYIVLFGAVSSCETGESIAEINQNARMAMDRMVSELRVCDGIVDTTTYKSTTESVCFLELPSTTKRYYYDDNAEGEWKLYYGKPSGKVPVAEYVDFFNLTYYHDGETITTGLYEDANRVKIEMEIEKDGIRRSFTSSAQLRNK